MDMTGIALIIVGIFVAVFATVLFGKNNKSSVNKSGSTSQSEVNNKVKKSGEIVPIGQSKQIASKADKGIQRKNIIDFMEFDKISDNMIIQEKETKFTMVIQCKGINYDLMSEIEQMAVEEGFITFLNTLKYPIQLYVQARAVDLKKSMNIYKQNMSELENKFKVAEDKFVDISNEINADYQDIKNAREEKNKYQHILEYGQDITKYVERISLNKHVLQRKYYIVLSYHKSEVTTTTEFTKDEIYDICYRELQTRALSLISALSACSVQGTILDSNGLAELLYISYNRDDEKLLDIRTALESGFYRLYSTSKDVFEKKEELMRKQVEEAALERVKTALVKNMEIQNGKTQDELIEEFEERTDREALNIINTSNISDDEKESLTDIIAQRHVIGVEKRKSLRVGLQQVREEAKESKKEKEEFTEKKDTNDLENVAKIENSDSGVFSESIDESIV